MRGSKKDEDFFNKEIVLYLQFASFVNQWVTFINSASVLNPLPPNQKLFGNACFSGFIAHIAY